MTDNREKIESLITEVVEGMGYIVWHIDLHHVSHKTLLRIFVDLPQEDARKSIGVDDCSKISEQIGAVLDVENLIAGSYVLEVSSPGLDRSLFKLEHYQRYLGSVIKIVLFNPQEGKSDFTGKIQDVFGDNIQLAVDGKEQVFALKDIKRAKLISDF